MVVYFHALKMVPIKKPYDFKGNLGNKLCHFQSLNKKF